MFSPKRALARLGAQIKGSLLLNLDKLYKGQARSAIERMKLAVHTMIAETRTRGAFGNARPSTRYTTRPGALNGAGLWRRNAASGKVRGY